MKSRLVLNHKINNFMKRKEAENPDLRTKSVDEMIEDLVNEERPKSVY